ncbi:hypothetical protein [Pseudoruegeria sp. HB172150]|uniref:hypothetical protein n=1 Tax=Pseudoruegeria sp. HB172150 TaxID=2721164 RepID=UPI0015539968|nr:hypothetical protein [Pseudoruegeria sp. HB172150]
MNDITQSQYGSAETAFLRSAKSTVRVLVGAYFLAAAVAMLIEPDSATLLFGNAAPAIGAGLALISGAFLMSLAPRVTAAALCTYLIGAALANAWHGLMPAVWGNVALFATVVLLALPRLEPRRATAQARDRLA